MNRQARRSWTTEEKQEFVQQARERIAAGETFSEVTRALEITQTSLRHWMRQFSGPLALKPVKIIQTTAGAGVCLVTPDGFRFEGLDIESAVGLLERLR